MSRIHLHTLRTPLAAVVLVGLAACRDSAPTTPAGSDLVPPPARASAGNVDGEDVGDDMGNGAPRVDDVKAVVALTHLRGRLRECEGADGHYFEDYFTLTGTSAGGAATDDRLTGDIELRVHDLFNDTKGIGPQTGTVVIREHGGRIKARGAWGAWGPADMAQGTIVGRTFDGGGGSDVLYANMRITYHDQTHIAMQIGGVAPDSRLPAGVAKGQCSTDFTPVDNVLVPTFTMGAASARTGTGAGRSWRNARP